MGAQPIGRVSDTPPRPTPRPRILVDQEFDCVYRPVMQHYPEIVLDMTPGPKPALPSSPFLPDDQDDADYDRIGDGGEPFIFSDALPVAVTTPPDPADDWRPLARRYALLFATVIGAIVVGAGIAAHDARIVVVAYMIVCALYFNFSTRR
jgi:hypothetical protein